MTDKERAIIMAYKGVTMHTGDNFERPKGKWKASDILPNMLACSVCGAQRNPKFMIGLGAWNFCPNCGAQMVGGGEDQNENL